MKDMISWLHPKEEPKVFVELKEKHNLRAMKIVLCIYLFFDILYYFGLGNATGGYQDTLYPWVIPTTLLFGLVFLVFLFYKQNKLSIGEEYLFMLYILGSRVLLGELFGFSDDLVTVYVGLMLLLGALFYFNWRIIHTTLLLQLLLHLQYFFFHRYGLTAMTLLVTNAFALTSALLSLERYTKRLHTASLSASLIEKNTELEHIHMEIIQYSDQMTEQLKRTLEAETLFKGLLDHTEGALMLVDLQNNLRYHNDGLRELIGYGFDEIHGKLLNAIVGDENATLFKDTLAKSIARKSSEALSLNFQHKDGSVCYAKIRFDYIDLSGNGYILVNISDVTEETVQRQQIIQLSQMKDVVLAINHKLSEDSNLETFFKYVLDQVKAVMPHGDFSSILLLEEDQNLYMVACEGYVQDDVERFKLPLQESFAYRVSEGNLTRTVIINNIPQLINPDYVKPLTNDDGIFVHSSISGPIIKEGKLFGLINIDSKNDDVFTDYDISIMEYLREQLGIALSLREMYRDNLYLSHHDQMTGFLNRWSLHELERAEAHRWRRNHDSVVIATMDLNNLKILNDQLGHHQGDAYICLFSRLMQEGFRSSDILIRLGGDEFAGIFFGITPEFLTEKMDDINIKIAGSSLQESVPLISLGFAYGIVRYDGHFHSIEVALQTADLKMYDKKLEMKRLSAAVH